MRPPGAAAAVGRARSSEALGNEPRPAGCARNRPLRRAQCDRGSQKGGGVGSKRTLGDCGRATAATCGAKREETVWLVWWGCRAQGREGWGGQGPAGARRGVTARALEEEGAVCGAQYDSLQPFSTSPCGRVGSVGGVGGEGWPVRGSSASSVGMARQAGHSTRHAPRCRLEAGAARYGTRLGQVVLQGVDGQLDHRRVERLAVVPASTMRERSTSAN